MVFKKADFVMVCNGLLMSFTHLLFLFLDFLSFVCYFLNTTVFHSSILISSKTQYIVLFLVGL